jgi:hypothetical protein
MQEVGGSIPPGSTSLPFSVSLLQPRWSRRRRAPQLSDRSRSDRFWSARRLSGWLSPLGAHVERTVAAAKSGLPRAGQHPGPARRASMSPPVPLTDTVCGQAATRMRWQLGFGSGVPPRIEGPEAGPACTTCRMYTTYWAHTKCGLMVYRPGVQNAGSIPLILAIVLLLNSYKKFDESVSQC